VAKTPTGTQIPIAILPDVESEDDGDGGAPGLMEILFVLLFMLVSLLVLSKCAAEGNGELEDVKDAAPVNNAALM
jgi:hypothetical protein